MAFNNEVPEDLLEEAYKRKFRLKNPMDELNQKFRMVAPEKKDVDEQALFNRNVDFLQSKGHSSNEMTVFAILDSDRDSVLTFSEF